MLCSNSDTMGDMKHAGPEALKKFHSLLEQLRKLFKDHPGMVERKTGTFYKKSNAFLHFHEDPTGMFADLKIDGQFERFEVSSRRQQLDFLEKVKDVLSSVGAVSP